MVFVIVSFLERYHNKPILISELENTTVSVGVNFTMTCKFVSDLHPYITWTRFINESYTQVLQVLLIFFVVCYYTTESPHDSILVSKFIGVEDRKTDRQVD